MTAASDYDGTVQDLGVSHRRKKALRALMAAGSQCTGALRQGLRDVDPAVRIGCAQVLDHFLDAEAVPELIENLDHENAGVRAWAMHALACDRCKEGSCRPAEDEVVPIALRMLVDDESRHVRQQAAGLPGPAVHRREDVLRALVHVHAHDPHPVVRKIAGWYVPGGPRFERLRPKPPRKPRP